MFTLEELYEKAHLLRQDTLEMCIDAKTGHLTSSLSVIEILISLYYGGIMNHDPKDPMTNRGLRDLLKLMDLLEYTYRKQYPVLKFQLGP